MNHRIDKVLVLSTAHLKQEEAERLDDEDSFALLSYMRWDYGWQFYVSLDTELETLQKNWASLGLSEGFYSALSLAYKLGCEWLRLDTDGDTDEDLPHYEW